jgi:hypothetical protein
MGKPIKVLSTTALLLVVAAVGVGVCLRWSLRHMLIDFPLAGLVNRLLPQAEIAAVAAGRHGACSGTQDQQSIGNREAEAEMSYVAAMPELYRTRFGRAPSSISDLNKLPEFEHADRLNNRSFSRDCSIYFDQSGSFAVSCGRPRPSRLDVAAFMRTAPSAQNFYMVGKSEILYIPVHMC